MCHDARDILDWHRGDGCALVLKITASIVILQILVMVMAMAAVVEMLLLIAIDVAMLVLILMTSLAIAMLIRQHDLHVVFCQYFVFEMMTIAKSVVWCDEQRDQQ